MPAIATQPGRPANGAASSRAGSSSIVLVSATTPRRARATSAGGSNGLLPTSALAALTRPEASRICTTYSPGSRLAFTTGPGGVRCACRYRPAWLTCAASAASVAFSSEADSRL